MLWVTSLVRNTAGYSVTRRHAVACCVLDDSNTIPITNGKSNKGTLPRLGQKGVGGALEGFPESKCQDDRREPPLDIKHPSKEK